MLKCNHCHKEVVIYGVSLGAATNDDLTSFTEAMVHDGKLILFNPPPFGPYYCPACGTKLETK